MRLRKAVEELTFRGLKLAFEVRSRYTLTMRADDELLERRTSVSVAELPTILKAFIATFEGDDVTISAPAKVTLEHGYLLLLEVSKDGKSVAVTFELSR